MNHRDNEMHRANRRQRTSESSMWLMTEQRSECTRCHVHDDDLFDSSEGDRWLEVPTSRVVQFSYSVCFSERLKGFFSKSSSTLIKVFSICLAPGYVFLNQSASHFSPSRELCAFCVHIRSFFGGNSNLLVVKIREVTGIFCLEGLKCLQYFANTTCCPPPPVLLQHQI